MTEGWKHVPVAEELYGVCKEYYERHKEELKLKEGIRSLSAFIAYCIREYMKAKGII